MDYDTELETCKRFLREHSEREDNAPKFKYMEQLQAIVNHQRGLLEISLDDLVASEGDEFAEKLASNTKRYVDMFAEAADAEMQTLQATVDIDADSDFQAMLNLTRRNTGAGDDLAIADSRRQFPAALMRWYDVVFLADAKNKPRAIREVRAVDIGHLVTVRGIVTRVTEVKPLVTIATYVCESCSAEVYQEVKSGQFMPLTSCPSQECSMNRRAGGLHHVVRQSRFVKYQEMKIQELSYQVPVGHIPRTMTVHLRGELTRTATAGDVVVLDGIFLPTPYTGFKALRAGLLSDTFLDAMRIERDKKGYDELEVTEEVRERIAAYARDASIYDRLSRSIAPVIYGHDDVKKALLLQLVGGTSRSLADGVKIRGDINICLMGDPGVAKSQLLKYIVNVAPRGVYTTGKGSSSVGLTASVSRDPVTGEMVLEGGALVLADQGICCIDEFDKMDEYDRTAIHEVMEQQTISIAKAGITTTLNARAAVLAAANPAYGRYNPRRSAQANINLPAALLSRFDLLFLMLDQPNVEDDLRLAQHITYVHQHNEQPSLGFEPMDAAIIRQYVSLAREYEPVIPASLSDYLVGAYLGMREEGSKGHSAVSYVSARSLLALVRVATALARLRFSDQVAVADVDEALRLISASKSSLNSEDKAAEQRERRPEDIVYEIMYEVKAQTNSMALDYDEVRRRAIVKGVDPEEFRMAIEHYAMLGILQVNARKTTIKLI